MPDERLLITGAGGMVAGLVRERMRRRGRVVRLVDIKPLETPAGDGEESLTGDVTDRALMARACEGVDTVIHLGGLSRESSWEQTSLVNITGTQVVLQAAQEAGVRRVVLASSNHAVGFRRVDEAGADGIPADTTTRPDTFYGVSKAAIEALGSLYHSRFGMDVIVIRIGSCFPDPLPLGPRGLGTWLSPDDAARLFEACLSAESPGYQVIWGVSDNTRRIYSLTEARALGYEPQDNAEVYADRLADVPESPGSEYVGGGFTTALLGIYNPP
ncbi:NAD-dependent epimerase/dehydratase family protein [Flexivirga caeni]|uniref:NAD(P)-dependent oxidoreductase n=1 Tax=Flexivirga caeni TaxID=2294115 RepID=A0A3M9LZB6_9MICO|nr:NAD(P)-dependent oxidoreductase [Flexivirga caeni]RNI18275.1 NAD(P)-dependent oxidoreductase [Flexivirga caeni]